MTNRTRQRPANRAREAGVLLGTYGSRLFPKRLVLSPADIRRHIHVQGISGSGKSRFLVSLIGQLLSLGHAVTFLDVHGETADLVLDQLIASGFFSQPQALDRLLFLDLPAAARQDRYLPFNVLAQPAPDHLIATQFKEAMHRAFPTLASGAAAIFDTLLPDAVTVLVANGQPLTRLYALLTQADLRRELLPAVEDSDIVAAFQAYDRLRPADQADYAGSVLRRARLLTRLPVLKYGFAQPDNVLDFPALLRTKRSTIINLALPEEDARKLLACLITVGIEQAALGRAGLPANERQAVHFLVIDEFAELVAQSGEALSAALSQLRKFNVFVVLCHQTWSQAETSRLRGALQNVGLEVVFRLGREDAEYSATILGRPSPLAVKYEVADVASRDRRAPVFASLAEQWESWTQAIQDLKQRQAFVLPPTGSAIRVMTPLVPDPVIDPGQRAAIRQHYLERYFRPRTAIEAMLATPPSPPAVNRFLSEEPVDDE